MNYAEELMLRLKELETMIQNGRGLENKVDKVTDAIEGNLPKLTADGNLSDSGLTLIKCTKKQYEDIEQKNPNALYIVDCNAPSFAGLQISSGPVFYSGLQGYELKTNWQVDSYNLEHGKNAGSSYFSFIDMGKLFKDDAFDANSGDIENLLDPFDGWRIATRTEFGNIFTSSPNIRPGATVNGNTKKHRSLLQIVGEGATFAGNDTPYGILFFPDNRTIIGKELNGLNNWTKTELTIAELNDYLSQGCAFFPFAGSYYSYSWMSGGEVYSSFVSEEYSSTQLTSIEVIPSVGFQWGGKPKNLTAQQIYLVREPETGIKLYLGSEIIADSNTLS